MSLRVLAVLTLAASSLWIFGGGPFGVYRKLITPGALVGATDLYFPWYGSRELLLHGRDPYGLEVTREIQSAYAGLEEKDPLWGQFAYPAYVAFLLAPAVGVSFGKVKIFFVILLALTTAISVPLWLHVIDWRLSKLATGAWMLMLVASPAVVQGLELQQLGLLVAGLISLSMFLLAKRLFVAAGSVLALASIKPQMILLLAPWLILWAVNNWKERREFVFGFLGTLALLTLAALILLPSWITEWIQAVVAYRRYGGHSFVDTLLGPQIGIFAALTILLSVKFIFRLRTAPEDSPEFALAIATILVLELLVTPLMAGYNQVLMVPALFLLLRRASNLFRNRVRVRSLA